MMNTLEVPIDDSRQEIDTRLYPLLSGIKDPSDIRKLDITQLTALCNDIRHFLINSLSENPGHFASSMGAVELTVALHYAFNTPYDRIVWDVGHQAYGHKLITGRAERFHTNRKLGGLSGFPNPAESEYDTFSAGHASNSISAALGMSVASSLNNESPRRNVVAVIGDASISGGLAFEGLNNAANANSNLLIVLNDNDMSIDRNVGSLNSYLAHLTTTKGYNTLRYKLFNALKKLHLVSDKNRGRIMRFNNSLKSLLTHEQNIFEGLNIRYFGPFDGHDLPRIIRVLNDIKDMNGPRILHLRTIKGKGFDPAEKHPAEWHAPGKFNPEDGTKIKSSKGRPTSKYQDVFGETIVELAGINNRITAITAAMLSGTSVSLMQQKYPERTFDVGISEGHAVTFAGGMATDGMLPYVAIYSSFLQRAYDQIIHDVSLQELPVTLCIDRAGIVGEDGMTHHGIFDLSYLRNIPGMTVTAPSDEQTLRNLLYTSQLPDRKGPWAIRYPRGNGNATDWQTDFSRIEYGKGRKLSHGADVTVMSIGTIASSVTKAIERASADGIGVTHYDMIFLNPIDESILREAAESGHPIITVEDGTVKGGLGSTVLEWLSANGYDNQVKILGVPDKFVPHGDIKSLHKLCKMDPDSIYSAIKMAKASVNL